MTPHERAALLRQYRDGARVVAEAVAGLSDADLDRRPSSGEWTPREIVHHLADSEMTSAIRLRRLIAEDNPTIYGYDEEEFARRLFYDRPIWPAMDAVRAARETSADICERLTDNDWARAGTHSESGTYGVEIWLEIYARHCHDHADQIRRAIARS